MNSVTAAKMRAIGESEPKHLDAPVSCVGMAVPLRAA